MEHTEHPRKVTFDWRITFGNLITIFLAVASAASVLLAGYVRYEGRAERAELRDIAHDKAIAQVAEIVGENRADLKAHAGDNEKHMPEKEKFARFISREEFREALSGLATSSKAERDRIEGQRKVDSEEIKNLIREQGRAQERQFSNLQARIDALLTESKRVRALAEDK